MRLAHGDLEQRVGCDSLGSSVQAWSLDAWTFLVDQDEYALLEVSSAQPSIPEALSQGQREVLQALLSGRRAAEIARERRTSVNTVRNQIRTIYAKLKVHSQRELIARCLR